VFSTDLGLVSERDEVGAYEASAWIGAFESLEPLKT
jgi:hypothetical protein